MGEKILIVTNTEDAHANVVEDRLAERSIEFARLNSDNFAKPKATWVSMSDSTFTFGEQQYLKGVSKVWYRKVYFPEGDSPTQSFIRQELQGLFESVLDMYGHAVWVNNRSALSRARLKLPQLEVAQKVGLLTPATIVTNCQSHLEDFYRVHGKQIVAKPIQAQVIGSGENACVVGTRTLTPEHFVAATEMTPCFAQEKLAIVAEYRVLVFGTRLFGFRLTPSVRVDDIKQAELSQIRHEEWQVEAALGKKLLALVKQYGLLFAAIDLVETVNGNIVFLELNPNGQWLWLQYMTGVNLLDPFIDFLQE